jgi:hypothetical protein
MGSLFYLQKKWKGMQRFELHCILYIETHKRTNASQPKLERIGSILHQE